MGESTTGFVKKNMNKSTAEASILGQAEARSNILKLSENKTGEE